MSGSKTTPQGQRFSHVYLDRGEPTADSKRMRHRLASLLKSVSDLDEATPFVRAELGVDIPSQYGGYDWHEFLAKCALRDALDVVTLAWRYLNNRARRGLRDTSAREKWLSGVARIFQEEAVSYRVDDFGGVHFAVDSEFEGNRAASIKSLSSARYANVLNEFEGAQAQFDAVPPNGKGAVRSTFAAAECLFRLMYPSAPRLTSSEIKKHLTPTLQRVQKDDATALGATTKMLASFQEWVDAAHFYRHEPGKEEIAQPPLTLAINMVSLGASFIRWLAEIDSAAQATVKT